MKKIFGFLFAFSLVQLAFAQEEIKTPKVPIGGRPNIPADLKVELGFNLLNNRPADISTAFFGSRSFNVYYQYPISIFGETSGFTFDPGFGISSNKFAFQDEQNLFNDPAKGPESSQYLELTEVFGDNIQVDKNNFAINYFDIPLDITYHANKRNYSKGFRVSLGARVGFLYNAHSKINYTDEDGLTRKVKDAQNYGLEKIRYGLSLKAGSPGFYFWSYVGLNKLFQEDLGPFNNEAQQLSFGVAIHLF
ncbi:Outer membrane protein beta-barrel domain-containing protein [Algoriphagus faecimaris]|uniref:Outer membrane protein beta-barrel domain-containing protein n=1 Tax=Algoriphagus faecimaris TaxID=686796 RepID=A0A1G6SDM8_9BACT|nr:porin family protein [Algoriphagus faecimaris]SDD14761.1 Outer membrane protein beta-barrel domain-containing protein [Algoriphagus faecimaris]